MNSARQTFDRALAALRTGAPAAAERELRAALAASPGDVNYQRLLGLALLAQSKAADAVDALERAVASAPDFAHARADLARTYRQLGRIDEALAEIRTVLRAAPALAPAWLVMGDVLVDRRKHAAARVAYRRFRRIDPHAPRLNAA